MSDNTPPCAGCGEYPGERVARLIQDQEATIRKQQSEIERLTKLCEHALELADTFALPNAPLAFKVEAARAALKGEGNG
jgi:hypothetical protein